MKFNNLLKVVGATLLVGMVSLSGWAKSNKSSIDLPHAVMVNGTQIPAGVYDVKWEGDNNNLQVSVLKGKKVLATSPAKLVEQDKKQDTTAILVNHAGGEPGTLSEIRFGGKKSSLVLGGDNGNQMSGQK